MVLFNKYQLNKNIKGPVILRTGRIDFTTASEQTVDNLFAQGILEGYVTKVEAPAEVAIAKPEKEQKTK